MIWSYPGEGEEEMIAQGSFNVGRKGELYELYFIKTSQPAKWRGNLSSMSK